MSNTSFMYDLSAGNCVGVGHPDLFIEVEYEKEARRVCKNCPVVDECLITGVVGRHEGVWGDVAQPGVLTHPASQALTQSIQRASIIYRSETRHDPHAIPRRIRGGR